MRSRIKDQHDRLSADGGGEIDFVHLVVGAAGVDLRQVTTDVGGAKHVFRVAAIDSQHNRDRSPAMFRFRAKRR